MLSQILQTVINFFHQPTNTLRAEIGAGSVNEMASDFLPTLNRMIPGTTWENNEIFLLKMPVFMSQFELIISDVRNKFANLYTAEIKR